MTVELYNNKDLPNTINKTLENATTFINVIMHTELNSTDFYIELETSNFSFNYCYIKELNKYYFIREYDILKNNLIRFYLKLDLLMTYKDNILNGKYTIKKSDIEKNALNADLSGVQTIKKYSYETPFIKNGLNILITEQFI